METYYIEKIDTATLCKRPSISQNFGSVRKVLDDVRKNGDKAVRKYTRKFDGIDLENFVVTKSYGKITGEKAFEQAAKNITKFQKAQITKRVTVETMPGVTCFREARPIEKIGLYIPGGTAPLPTTVLMLGIPAKLAGCREIIMCTPPNPANIILYAAELAGIDKIYQIGGAQAIAAMAYGTETIPKVDKICGPGNQYVTSAKQLVQAEGVAIDMPAGPSEVLVIADENARPDFVAADLLSQAEHGPDSQVVLVCKNPDEILKEVEIQLEALPRKEIARRALKNSFTLIVKTIDQAISFANRYAPEHLILNIKNPSAQIRKIINAGSVFLGRYSCESAGDYASGTNHTLPTYGYAKAYSGVSIDTFTKQLTFQKITKLGAKNIGSIVEKMAETEGLQAHKNAMQLRTS